MLVPFYFGCLLLSRFAPEGRKTSQLSAEFRAGATAMAELGAYAELDRSEEGLGVPEGKGRLKMVLGSRCGLVLGMSHIKRRELARRKRKIDSLRSRPRNLRITILSPAPGMDASIAGGRAQRKAIMTGTV